ncbi:hypothetical protein WOLCODRAFT_122132 [Wolfiporia cocos MD-104 SS10]|uniref:Mei2-like C-terminal RNA recognition motif domain-containing protein n=1 Tax=Wolfiporia cocos (strain MD-104) TaxID=742152 RepID=A0A2H3JU90_WOLCO|nr:hypothetical protein WOLCODRAFT_122132 [Wolfiporia cocos MD-104 SS10]
MDTAPVTFPSLTVQPEEAQNAEQRPPLHTRGHSSPSLPDLWCMRHRLPVPAVPTPTSPTAPRTPARSKYQARYRPHLRPLDLASAPVTPPSKARYAPAGQRSASNSPCRSALVGGTLLTPPLTPSSSFNSTSGGADGPATPPEALSPLRWVHAIADSPTAMKGGKPLQSLGPAPGSAGYLTPSSARSQSISSESGADAVAALAAGMAAIDIDTTPREERTAGLGDALVSAFAGIGSEGASEVESSRFLLVRNVPPQTPSEVLRGVFAPTGDIKCIWVRFQQTHGVVVLAYYDVRHAMRARRMLGTAPLPALGDARVGAAFVSAEQLEMMAVNSPFADETDGRLFVSVENGRIEPTSLQNVLASFGELKSFTAADSTYHAEYYDVRDAANAFRALNNRPIFGARLQLFASQTQASTEQAQEPMLDDPFQVNPARAAALSAFDYGCESQHKKTNSGVETEPQQISQQQQRQENDREIRCIQGRVRPRSVSASENMGGPDAVRRLSKGRESPLEHSRRSSNDLFFDAVGKASCYIPAPPQTPSRPRALSIGPEELTSATTHSYPLPTPPQTYPYAETSYAHAYASGPHPAYAPAPQEYSPPYVPPIANAAQYGAPYGTPESGQWTYAAPQTPAIQYYIPPSPRGVCHQPHAAPSTPRRQCQDKEVELASPFEVSHPPHASNAPEGGFRERPSTTRGRLHAGNGSVGSRDGSDGVGEKNQLRLDTIEKGEDMRTTVMIKNIPNKMSDRDLLGFIDRVCPRRIDFLYLRMDFQNGCNVGYAFVNFITTSDLLLFAQTMIGVKWNMYSSEKALEMRYATYQGKEALVEKFKNSCIMDERESWRPKIFYSDGPNQGLPEPFPAPTHLRRKERSSHNRGALFVPGAQHQRRDREHGRSAHDAPHHGHGHHYRTQPPRMLYTGR